MPSPPRLADESVRSPECGQPEDGVSSHRRTPSGARAVVLRSFSGGFTLLELVIVITLIVLLFLTAWHRLMPLRGDAEAAHVTSVVGNLRSALGLATAERVTIEGIDALDSLEAINPMTLLDQAPDTYIGVDPADPAPGSWYFDDDMRELRYRVRYPQYMQGRPQAPVDLAWRVVLAIDDDKPKGIRLRALHTYRWPGDSQPLRQLREAPGNAEDDQPAPAPQPR